MAELREYTFQFGDGGTHDASVSESSAVLTMCYNHAWSLIPVVSGLDASPLWTLEVSFDGVAFHAYDAQTDGADIDQGFDDTHATFKFWRVTYDAGANTTGTVSFTLVLK